MEIAKVEPTQIDQFEVILIGSPNHMGNAAGNISKFIDKLGSFNLEGKQGAVFDTYSTIMAGDFEKVLKKMERQINEKVSWMKLATPGLSIRVNKMKGPMAAGELPKCKEFGIEVAAQVRK